MKSGKRDTVEIIEPPNKTKQNIRTHGGRQKDETFNPIVSEWSDQMLIEKEKRKKTWTCCLDDFAVLVDHWVKIKESDKYLDLARELK